MVVWDSQASLKTWAQLLLSPESFVILISPLRGRFLLMECFPLAFHEMVPLIRHCFILLLPTAESTEGSICLHGICVICVSMRHQHKHNTNILTLIMQKKLTLGWGCWQAWGNGSQGMKSKASSMELGPEVKSSFSRNLYNLISSNYKTSCYIGYEPLSACCVLLPHPGPWEMKSALLPQLQGSIILLAYPDFIWGMYVIQS